MTSPNANPECLTCRGSGLLDDDDAGRVQVCACVELPRRDPTAPPAEGWLADALRPMLEQAERLQAESEAHARSCTDRPCERCARFVCKCGAPADGVRKCAACSEKAALAKLLRPTHESVPERFKWALGADLERLRGTAEQRRVKGSDELIRRGLANPPSSDAVFLGLTGAGKTSLAVAMLDAWVRVAPHERTGALFVGASYLSRARARFRLGDGEAPLIAAAQRAPLLVLDDLGNEREDRDGCITDVVFGRHDAGLPTWVTCGLTPNVPTVEAFAEVIAKRYDGGFARRVLETGIRVQLGSKAAAPAPRMAGAR